MQLLLCYRKKMMHSYVCPLGTENRLFIKLYRWPLTSIHVRLDTIVVVISPLLTLIEDQIQNLRIFRIRAISLSHIKTSEEIRQVEIGSFAIVRATPESLLKTNDGETCCRMKYIARNFAQLLLTSPCK